MKNVTKGNRKRYVKKRYVKYVKETVNVNFNGSPKGIPQSKVPLK